MKSNFQLLSITALSMALPIIESASAYALPHIFLAQKDQRIAATPNATEPVDQAWQIVNSKYIDPNFTRQDFRQRYVIQRSYNFALTSANSQQIAPQPTTSLLSQTTQTSPKQFVDEVWQIIDRTYIDSKFNGQDWKAVRQKYLSRSYKSVEEAYNAVDEMLKLLGDPGTRLLRPTTFSQSLADINSEIVGIGVKLAKDEQTQKITVVTTLENSPAMKAGIKAGDIITKVDGKTTEGMNVDGVTKLIRG